MFLAGNGYVRNCSGLEWVLNSCFIDGGGIMVHFHSLFSRMWIGKFVATTHCVPRVARYWGVRSLLPL